MVNHFGNIFEGNIDPQGQINGFCITYIGGTRTITAGWYKNS